jgi:hypothetical protein
LHNSALCKAAAQQFALPAADYSGRVICKKDFVAGNLRLPAHADADIVPEA